MIQHGHVAWGVFTMDDSNFVFNNNNSGSTHGATNYNFNSSRVVPTSFENRPASLSVNVYITY